jgi:hypothetical protein
VLAVDFAIISPAWIATWDKTAPIIDAPFISRTDPTGKSASTRSLPVDRRQHDQERRRFIGYAARHPNYPIQEAPQLDQRFPDLSECASRLTPPSEAFSRRIKATPDGFMEVYNAIKTGVLDGLENETAGLEGMKFYEVAPYYSSLPIKSPPMINGMSEKKFQSYPKELQKPSQAGAEASAGTEGRGRHDATILKNLQESSVSDHSFDNTEMRKKAMPAVVITRRPSAPKKS